MKLALAVVTLGACSFQAPIEPDPGPSGNEGRDGGTPDSTVFRDAPPQPADGCVGFASQFDTCTVSFKHAVRIDTAKIYDTDSHELSDYPSLQNTMVLDSEHQVNVMGKEETINVWLATTFDLSGSGSLRVVGSKPFGIVANGTIRIDGLLDAGSDLDDSPNLPGFIGAGAHSEQQCGNATPDTPGPHIGGSAGGGGGAFQGDGGDGGNADNNDGGQDGKDGGNASGKPLGPRGGCPGGRGGAGPGQSNGAAGEGGGAIYLVSAVSITVSGSGKVTAGGDGGGGGIRVDGGAGGGGSGGMILVEAPTVTIDGVLAANGGGGGGGSGNQSGTSGQRGQASDQAADGGLKGGAGSDGVAGSAGTSLAGKDNENARPGGGGGGGGGGAGFTAVMSPNPVMGGSAKISPPLIAWP